MMKRCTILIMVLSYATIIYSGFAEDTLVKTAQGYVQIQDLSVGDLVCGVNKQGELLETEITHVVSYQASQYMVVHVVGEQIVVARGQKFFLPLKDVWRKAKRLCEHDVVLSALYDEAHVAKLENYKDSVTFYEIRLRSEHAFVVTKSDIVVHNCPLFSIGFLVTWGCGKITVDAVWGGVCLFGVWLGTRFCKSSMRLKLCIEPIHKGCNYTNQIIDKHEEFAYEQGYKDLDSFGSNNVLCRNGSNRGCNYPRSQHQPELSCGSPTCVPMSYGPHGCHIPSPKHDEKQKGSISPALSEDEAQQALDVSAEGKGFRIVIWGGKYVIFRQTDKVKNTWHNYYLENFAKIDPEIQQEFIKKGLVKGKKGKILKDAKLRGK